MMISFTDYKSIIEGILCTQPRPIDLLPTSHPVWQLVASCYQDNINIIRAVHTINDLYPELRDYR